MKKIATITLSTFAIFSLSAFTLFEKYSYSIDPNYTLKFSTAAASGSISGLKGTVLFAIDNLSGSKIDITLDAASINTGNSLKDTHAKGEEWMNVAKFPLIKFSSKSISKEAGHYMIDGTMELHGVNKAVKIPAEVIEKDGKDIFSGSFSINREDYGVTGAGLKAKIVGDNIKISFNIPTTKQP